MPSHLNSPLPLDLAQQAVSAVEIATQTGALWPLPRGSRERSAAVEAARSLSLPVTTLKARLAAAWRVHGLAPNGIAPATAARAKPVATPAPEPAPQASPQEQRAERLGAEFWRRKAKAAEASLASAEHLTRELAGLRSLSWQIPDWLLASTDPAERGRSVVGCLVSDVHMGEVIQPDEILGVNRFDPDVCRARLKRYFEAACTIGRRWASDTQCEGALLVLGGDMVSGSIHDELAATNALTSPEQVVAVVETIAAGIRLLAQEYGRVHVVSVPGNHGRTTPKPTAKLYARLSYDIMVAAMLQERFRHDERLTFQHGESKDQIVPIFGRTVFVTHGDKIGTKGGMGFAGPMLPIVRGTKKVEAQQARFGRRPDLILHGHYHTTGNAGAVLSNGSVPGYGEYADDLRAEPEAPQQWLFLLHSRWGLRERAPIQLEAPGLPPKPRVKVPAGWETRDAA